MRRGFNTSMALSVATVREGAIVNTAKLLLTFIARNAAQQER
jgi:hypothetical protein